MKPTRRERLKFKFSPLFSLTFLLLASVGLLYHSVSGPDWRVYAVSYGHSTDYKKSHFVPGARPDELTDFEWMFWVIREGKKIILVDTGASDRERIRNWAVRRYLPPDKPLRALGIFPHEVTDIILTHAHWDHAGSLALFPRATVWIQKKEFEHWRSLFETKPVKSFRQGYLLRDYQALQKIQREGRLRILEGNQKVFPGIRVSLAGRHTPGLQTVTVRTEKGAVRLLSDEAYFYENMEQTERENANDSDLSIPGHDPTVLHRFFDRLLPNIVELSPEKAVLRYRSKPLFSIPETPLPLQWMREDTQDLHLLFVGDVNLARAVEQKIKESKTAHRAFSFVQPLFHLADIRTGNLECVLSNAPLLQRPGHPYYLKAEPALASLLKSMPFDVLSLANNHALDAGEKGLSDTLNALFEQGIRPLGVPNASSSFQAPVTLEKKGIKLAFLAYNDVEKEAGKKFSIRPFAADPERISAEVRRSRQNHDLVIVSFHWGREYDHLATNRQRELAQAALEAGADLIVGHHPHAVQEITWLSKTKQVVAYSLGNFIFDLFEPSRLRKVRRSMILYVSVDPRSKKIRRFYPLSVYLNKDFQPVPLFEIKSLASLVNPDAGRKGRGDFDLMENLKRTTVSLEQPGKWERYDTWKEKVQQFNFFNENYPGEIVLHERWQHGSDPKSAVGVGAEFSHGEFRKVIWLHATQGKKVRIETPPLKFQNAIEGFSGFPDWAVMEPGGKPVEIQIFAGNRLIYSKTMENRPGWNDFRIDTSRLKNQTLPLKVEFTTPGSRRRYVGFDLWIPRS